MFYLSQIDVRLHAFRLRLGRGPGARVGVAIVVGGLFIGLTSWQAKIRTAAVDHDNLSRGQAAAVHYQTALSDGFGIWCSSALVMVAVLLLTGQLQ